MKNLKFTLFVCFFTVLAFSANAQFNIGIKAGFNASTITGGDDIDDEGYSKNYKPGFHVGVAAQYMFTKAAGIETGLYYSTLGVVEKNEATDEFGSWSYKTTLNPSYIQLPLAFIYKFEVGQDLFLYPSVGIYAGYGIAGKGKIDIEATGQYKDQIDELKEEYGDIDGVDYFGDNSGTNRFDMGATLGLNLQYSKFTIGLGYDLGLTKINKNEFEGSDDLKNGNIKISLGYFF